MFRKYIFDSDFQLLDSECSLFITLIPIITLGLLWVTYSKKMYLNITFLWDTELVSGEKTILKNPIPHLQETEQ